MQQREPDFNRDLHYSKAIAHIEIDLKALEITELRVLSALASGGNPGAESSVMKISTVDIEQRTHQLAVDVIETVRGLGYRIQPVDDAV